MFYRNTENLYSTYSNTIIWLGTNPITMFNLYYISIMNDNRSNTSTCPTWLESDKLGGLGWLLAEHSERSQLLSQRALLLEKTFFKNTLL